MNLDKKDKEILLELIQDPRATIAEIARKIGVQRDTVTYRIEKFEKTGLIKKYHTIIDPFILGKGVFMMVMIKVKPVTSIEMNKFVKKLITIAEVTDITRIHGNYDYILTMAAESIQASDDVLDKIKSIKKDFITNIDVFNIVDEPKTDDFTGLIKNMPTWGE